MKRALVIGITGQQEGLILKWNPALFLVLRRIMDT